MIPKPRSIPAHVRPLLASRAAMRIERTGTRVGHIGVGQKRCPRRHRTMTSLLSVARRVCLTKRVLTCFARMGRI